MELKPMFLLSQPHCLLLATKLASEEEREQLLAREVFEHELWGAVRWSDPETAKTQEG